MNKWIALSLLVLIIVACGGGKISTPLHAPKHEVERIVLDFVKNVKQNKYSENIYFFEADTEFTAEEQEHYFRRLEKFVKNHDWNLHFTVIDVWEGNDDASDVILKASSGELVIFCLGYWYDTETWELDAYEFPGLTFSRTEDQSYEDYVQEIIDNSKDYGVDYSKKETIEDEGSYYIQY
ncbi:MAG: hypothetical protein WBB37_01320 [bacterium]